MIKLPETFPPSKRAPSLQELDWLNNWLSANKSKYKMDTVLEFGCGITSWVLSESLNPVIHVSMEGYQPCIDLSVRHVPNLKVIKTDWNDIPRLEYNVLFVDASTNPPKTLKPIDDRIFRHDAIKFSESFIDKQCIIIIHDWNYKTGWKLPREYLENNGYELLDSIDSRFGFGVYRK